MNKYAEHSQAERIAKKLRAAAAKRRKKNQIVAKVIDRKIKLLRPKGLSRTSPLSRDGFRHVPPCCYVDASIKPNGAGKIAVVMFKTDGKREVRVVDINCKSSYAAEGRAIDYARKLYPEVLILTDCLAQVQSRLLHKKCINLRWIPREFNAAHKPASMD